LPANASRRSNVVLTLQRLRELRLSKPERRRYTLFGWL
jgi:hypothetical protein